MDTTNAAAAITQTPITEAELLTVDFPSDGEKVLNVVGAPTGEVVVYDKDEDGNVLGWHKEIA